ncbi:hypothetical protein V6Z11_A10G132500 [Gossypium hirsutum]
MFDTIYSFVFLKLFFSHIFLEGCISCACVRFYI